MADLRQLLDADRDNLLDVADWLAVMPQENFDKHVRLDLTGQIDQVAHDALRHPTNVQRWHDSLSVILRDVRQQLADPGRRGPEYNDWRNRARAFEAGVLTRRVEASALVRHGRQARSAAASAEERARSRREAGERAVQRLKDAHGAEFCRYLAEEYAADGIPLPDRIYRQLRDHATREADGDG